ncbi:MAG: HAMP domain-containing histidine kinase [Lachnospiraceae bacterium]|nr:HAMP domain-containing histidine kinase [Lachnospiraceae bacterium]
MRFFTKLFLCTIVLMTMALSLAEYYTVSLSLESAVGHQVENGLEQHQLITYAIRSGMFNASMEDDLQEETVKDIVIQTSEAMSVQLQVYNLETKEIIYSNSYFGNQDVFSNTNIELTEGYITYELLEQEQMCFLCVKSSFLQSGYTLELLTIWNVTKIFEETSMLQIQYQKIFFVVMFVAALLMFVFSWILTRPIKRLTEASEKFAKGEYSCRIDTVTKDEIGDLAKTYNQMADALEEKIHALEFTVQKQEDFVANFAHELKTPMTSIIGYADILYQKELSFLEVQKAAGYIVNEGMRLEALSFKLLQMITLEKMDFLLEETDMHLFFQDIESSISVTAQNRNILLKFSCEKAFVRLEYDLFKTMILNLLDNALKSGADKVELKGIQSKNQYIISIKDNGRGIPKNQLERIKEPFYMVDKSRARKENGAGLGLALCEKIAILHNTKCVYESKEHIGTTVTVHLNICDEEIM